MQSSVTATIHPVTSSQDAASAGSDCGARGASDTANASTASATRRTARVPAHQGTAGSSAGSHVPPASTARTAGTGEGNDIAGRKCSISKTQQACSLAYI